MRGSQAVLTWDGKVDRRVPAGAYRLTETFEPFATRESDEPDPPAGALYHDDSRPVLAHLAAENAGKVKLAYLDPPYLSGVAYAREATLRESGRLAGRVAEFDDRLGEAEYLQRLYECLLAVRDLLAPDGSVWVHCDFRQSHHLRCLLDEVFGADAFRNEVVWVYGSTARGAKAVGRQLPRNHDVLLWYAGPSARYRPLAAERRISLAEARQSGYQLDAAGRPFRTAPRGDYTDASVARLEREGRIHRSKSGRVRVKYFARRDGDDLIEDRLLGDVWTDVPDAMHLPADEPTGYPTQKPERLLERVVLASTDPGDLVLDPFCGSGTTLAVARRLGRRWIGVDSSRGAIQAARRRLAAAMETDPTTWPSSPRAKGERPGDIPSCQFPLSPRRGTSPRPTAVGGKLEGLPAAGGDGGRPAAANAGEGPSAATDGEGGLPLPEGEGWGEGAARAFRVFEPIGLPEQRAPGISARVLVRRVGDDQAARLLVEVESYRSPRLAEQLGGPVDWREALDCVLIDPAYDGEVFRARLVDAPPGRRASVRGRYEVTPPARRGRVAVRLVDVLGDETLVVLPW